MKIQYYHTRHQVNHSILFSKVRYKQSKVADFVGHLNFEWHGQNEVGNHVFPIL